MDPQRHFSHLGGVRYDQVRSRKRLSVSLVLLIASVLIFSFTSSATTIAQARTAYIRRAGAIEMKAGADGLSDPATVTRVEAGHFGLQAPHRMTFDPASGRLFILDEGVPRIARIDPAAEPSLNRAAA